MVELGYQRRLNIGVSRIGILFFSFLNIVIALIYCRYRQIRQVTFEAGTGFNTNIALNV